MKITSLYCVSKNPLVTNRYEFKSLKLIVGSLDWYLLVLPLKNSPVITKNSYSLLPSSIGLHKSLPNPAQNHIHRIESNETSHSVSGLDKEWVTIKPQVVISRKKLGCARYDMIPLNFIIS